jgi:hypothetical protein
VDLSRDLAGEIGPDAGDHRCRDHRTRLQHVRRSGRYHAVGRDRAAIEAGIDEGCLPLLRGRRGLPRQSEAGQTGKRGSAVAGHSRRGRRSRLGLEEHARGPRRFLLRPPALFLRVGRRRRNGRWSNGLAAILRIEDRASKVTRQRWIETGPV